MCSCMYEQLKLSENYASLVVWPQICMVGQEGTNGYVTMSQYSTGCALHVRHYLVGISSVLSKCLRDPQLLTAM